MAWASPNVTMRSRQQLLRALVVDIIADVDEAARDVILTVHWRGGQHSQLRVRKPRSGEHGCRTPDEALAVMRSMAAVRRAYRGIAESHGHANRSGQNVDCASGQLATTGAWYPRLSFRPEGWRVADNAAAALGVSRHTIRRLVQASVLPAAQVVPDAPYQILSSDLHSHAVSTAIARKGRPCRSKSKEPLPMFPDT
jgi:hypothetical protein